MRAGRAASWRQAASPRSRARANFGEVEAEHVVQQEARTLQRRQTLEQQHQRHREIMREIAAGIGIERFVHHRLGKPLPDIDLATGSAPISSDRGKAASRRYRDSGAAARPPRGRPDASADTRPAPRLRPRRVSRACGRQDPSARADGSRRIGRHGRVCSCRLGQYAQDRPRFAADREPRASPAVAQRIFQRRI